MHWLLIGYMFLFIHRPFEVWPVLGDFRIERLYMLGMLGVWLFAPGKRWLPNLQHGAYALLALGILTAWLLSPWMDQGQPIVEDWLKVLVFYFLLVTCINDEKKLKVVVGGFIVVMALYLSHSLREYFNGRHTFRMGIPRMIGVDRTLGDPNSFGASIVFALPFVVCLWKSRLLGRLGQLALAGYTLLSAGCILLTGSRSSLLGLAVWAFFLVLTSSRRWLLLGLFSIAAPVGFLLLPDNLQNRFETIINPEVGPANAKESGEGRIIGFFMGLELWGRSPLSGVGPGAWRPATGSTIESHNLFGQLVGETGTLGLIGFSAILVAFTRNYLWIRNARSRVPEWQEDFLFHVGNAVAMGVLLLLFMGLFGHNLFRYSWLWYGGFLIIARHCLEQRVWEWSELTQHDFDCDEENQNDTELPTGWERHNGHVLTER